MRWKPRSSTLTTPLSTVANAEVELLASMPTRSILCSGRSRRGKMNVRRTGSLWACGEATYALAPAAQTPHEAGKLCACSSNFHTTEPRMRSAKQHAHAAPRLHLQAGKILHAGMHACSST